MIENLNTGSFKSFGKIVNEGFYHAIGMINYSVLSVMEHEIREKTVEKFIYLPDSPVVLDIVEGIAILCVSEDPRHSETRVFLLDKAIYINPGIYYSVFALYGSCVIKTAYKGNSEIVELEYPRRFTSLGFDPKVDIKKVNTLFYQEKEKGFIFKGEKHNFWELTYIDRGSMFSIVDERGYRLNQGEAIFYGIDQHHIQWADVNESICFVTITFDMDFEDSSFITGRKFPVDTEMRELLEKILNEKEQNSYYADDIIICYLKEFIIKLIRNEKLETTIHQQDMQIKNKIENSIVARTIEFIKDNIGRKLIIADIAKSIPISQSYLSTIFKKHMDMTLIDYTNNYRLEKSKEIIRSSDLNFTQIADMLGYASVHYFSNQFKLKYGITPSDYARSIKK